ncbi:Uncharacterized protein FWK35_00009792, partial [Aphis craccivora]
EAAKNILWETLDSEIHVIRLQRTRGFIVSVFGLHNSRFTLYNRNITYCHQRHRVVFVQKR